MSIFTRVSKGLTLFAILLTISPFSCEMEINLHNSETIATLFLDNDGNIRACRMVSIHNRAERKEYISTLQWYEKTTFNNLMRILRVCETLPGNGTETGLDRIDETTTYSTVDMLMQTAAGMWVMTSGIVPGTRWCGVGNVAEYWHHFGYEVDLDICCRTHDMCPRKINPLETKYGLTNYGLYTRSHCDCDTLFYDCLKRTEVISTVANLLGHFYFNILRNQCITEEIPPPCLIMEKNGTSCVQWDGPDTRKGQMMILRDTLRY